MKNSLIGMLGGLFLLSYSSGMSPLLAIWITSNTTQTGGVFDNTGGLLLEIGHDTNDPTLTLAAGATTTNINAVIAGGLSGDSGEVVVSGGSVLSNNELAVSGFNIGSYNGTSVFSNYAYLGFESGSTGSATVTGPGSAWNNGGVFNVGESGTGTLLIEQGGSVTNSTGYIGHNAGSLGSATVTGTGSTWMNSFSLAVGWEGTGTLEVSNGGEVSASSLFASVGNLSGDGVIKANGAVLDDVTLSFDSTHGLQQSVSFGTGGQIQLDVDGTGSLGAGHQGTGSLIIQDGIAVVSTGGIIGNIAGSQGSATVTGDGSTWNYASALYVGRYGNGTLLIEEGATVQSTSFSASTYIGFHTTSNSEATVTGADSTWNNSGELYVGYIGTGTLNIENGGSVSSLYGYLGFLNSGDGTATVSGENSTWTNTSTLHIGHIGAGELLVELGGSVSSVGGQIGLGSTNATGLVTVTGAGSTWNNTGSLILGYDASLNIEQGGSVSNTSATIGYSFTTPSEVTVTGEDSTWLNSGVLYVGGIAAGTLLVEQSGSVHSTGGFIGRNSSTSGEVTVTGAGSIWENSGDLIMAGFSLSAGTTATGTLDVLDQGTVSVAGTTKMFSGATMTIDGGTLTTGSLDRALGTFNHHDGTVQVDGGTYTQAAGALLISGNTALANPSFQLLNGATAFNAIGVEAVVVGNLADRQGELLISGGSTLTNGGTGSLGTFGTETVQRGETYIGLNADSAGKITVSGDGSSLDNSERVYVGHSGNGTLLIEAGGSVSNTFHAFIGLNNGSTGEVTVTGSGSTWNSDGDLVLGGTSLTNETTGTGTLTIATGGKVDVLQKIKTWGNGTINLQPHGTLKVNHFDFADGTFNFTGGTLEASGTVTGNVIVPDGGLVKGSGDFANLSVLDGGTVAPGNSPGPMSSIMTVWGAGGSYNWEINSLLSDSGIAGMEPGWDLWDTNDLTVSATGANPFNIVVNSLTLGNMDGALLNWDNSLSNSWLIATADIGTFNGITLSALAIDSTQFTGFNSLGGGSFSLLSANSDSELYLNFTPFSETTNPAVPEPSSMIMLVLGSILVVRRKRQKLDSK